MSWMARLMLRVRRSLHVIGWTDSGPHYIVDNSMAPPDGGIPHGPSLGPVLRRIECGDQSTSADAVMTWKSITFFGGGAVVVVAELALSSGTSAPDFAEVVGWLQDPSGRRSRLHLGKETAAAGSWRVELLARTTHSDPLHAVTVHIEQFVSALIENQSVENRKPLVGPWDLAPSPEPTMPSRSTPPAR